MRFSFLAPPISAALLLLVNHSAYASPFFTGLGFLNENSPYSHARSVSADGSVVVGVSGAAAFRWTEVGGLEEIPSLLNGGENEASGVSGDGSTVVGRTDSSQGREGFSWSSLGGFGPTRFGPQRFGPQPWMLAEAKSSHENLAPLRFDLPLSARARRCGSGHLPRARGGRRPRLGNPGP